MRNLIGWLDSKFTKFFVEDINTVLAAHGPDGKKKDDLKGGEEKQEK